MLTFVIVLVILGAILEGLSLKDTLDFVTYSTRSTKPLVEPGESFEVVSVFQNTRRLPISFMEVQEDLPVDISIDLKNVRTHYVTDDHLRLGEQTKRVRSTLYLFPRQRLVRQIPAKLPKRGRYLLRGGVIQRGDFLGFHETYRDLKRQSEIIVIPAPASEDPGLAPLGNFLGDISVRRFIMEDPVLTLGFNEYTGREPQRDISWVQSARMGRIMVKKYDYTLEPAVTVVLNVECGGEEPDEALIERCFSLTRTVCEALEERRIKYGFLTNAVAAGWNGHWPIVVDGLGKGHLMAILESLGRATYRSSEPVGPMIERALRSADQGRSHIVVTPFEYAGLSAGIERLRALTGGDVVVIPARV
jgi:hypothetical protein